VVVAEGGLRREPAIDARARAAARGAEAGPTVDDGAASGSVQAPSARGPRSWTGIDRGDSSGRRPPGWAACWLESRRRPGLRRVRATAPRWRRDRAEEAGGPVSGRPGHAGQARRQVAGPTCGSRRQGPGPAGRRGCAHPPSPPRRPRGPRPGRLEATLGRYNAEARRPRLARPRGQASRRAPAAGPSPYALDRLLDPAQACSTRRRCSHSAPGRRAGCTAQSCGRTAAGRRPVRRPRSAEGMCSRS